MFTLAVSYMSLGNIWATMTKAQNRLAALIQLIPMCLLVMFGFLWSADPDENSIYRSHPKLTAGTLGMLFTHMTNQACLFVLVGCADRRWSRSETHSAFPFSARVHVNETFFRGRM